MKKILGVLMALIALAVTAHAGPAKHVAPLEGGSAMIVFAPEGAPLLPSFDVHNIYIRNNAASTLTVSEVVSGFTNVLFGPTVVTGQRKLNIAVTNSVRLFRGDFLLVTSSATNAGFAVATGVEE